MHVNVVKFLLAASVKETLTSESVCFMLQHYVAESPGLFGTNKLCLISRVRINTTVHSKKVETNKESSLTPSRTHNEV